jgi:hypothetical protein
MLYLCRFVGDGDVVIVAHICYYYFSYIYPYSIPPYRLEPFSSLTTARKDVMADLKDSANSHGIGNPYGTYAFFFE